MTTAETLLRVLVAEDQKVVRDGLVVLLGMLPGVEVIGSAVDGDDAVRQALALAPDVVLAGEDGNAGPRPARRLCLPAWPGPLRPATLVKQFFDHRLAGPIARPRRAWAVAGVLAVAGLVSVPQIGGRSLLPTLQDHSLMVQLQTMPGTSLPEAWPITPAAGLRSRRCCGATPASRPA